MKNLGIVIFLIGLAHVTAQNEFNSTDLELEVNTSQIDETTTLSSVTNGTKKQKSWGVIYPGTKWCGQGNKAKHDNDFGKYERTDRCCRDHDRCPDKIKGKTSKYGIQNNGSVTILSCQCDETFYDCLKGVRTKSSKIVGTLYFDIVKNKCFKQSPDNTEEFVMSKTRKFSKNKFIRFIGRMFG